MNPNRPVSPKADPLLQEALRQAETGQRMRALVLLETPSSPTETNPDPAAFNSRVEWQKALVAQRKSIVAAGTQSVRQALQALDLQVMGGTLSSTVVVEGTAEQIAASLALPGVRHASLDREISIK